MSYTIDTIANSSIVVDDEYERRSLAEQGWELTDRPVLQTPIDGATGVSQTPTFQWAEYVKDIPIENLVYKLEVVAIASSGTTPNWTNAFVLVTESTTANLREQLADAQFYAWRVSALSRTQPETFIDTFERASLGADYETTTLQGVGNASIVSDKLVIEVDATSQVSRQAVRLIKNFENPDIVIKGVEFSNTTTDFQPLIYFNEQGVIQNNQMNGYYLFKLGDSLRVGKSVNYSPQDKQSATLSIPVNAPYDIRKQVVNGHVRISVWESANPESGPILDWTDSSNPYLSGGITFIPVAVSGAGVQTMTIDDIEVTFSEGEVTDITGVTISGSTSDLEEEQTRQFSASVAGTGNVQQSVDWSVTGGTFEVLSANSMIFTASTGAGACSVTATSTQDENVSDTLNFNRVEASAPVSGDTQGDIDALQAMASSITGLSSKTGWSTTGMSLSPAPYGVTVVNDRVTRINLFQEGLSGNSGLPSEINNLTEMEYFNVMYNEIDGPLPQFNLPKCKWLYLNHSFNVQDPNVELHDKAEGTAGGGRDVHNGKNDTGAKNKFTGNLYVDSPVIEYLACSWTNISTISVDQLFSNSTFKGLWIGDNVNASNNNYTVPSSIGNMTGLTHLTLSSGNSANENVWGGELPSVMSNLTLLYSLRLDKNDFTGAFPDLSNCPDLQTCGAFFTTFTSGFPSYLWDGTAGQINSFSFSWNGNNYTDATYPTGFTNNLRSINAIQCNLSGSIPTLNTGVTVTDFSYNPNTTGAPENGRFLFRIRNLRWRNCSISSDLIELDWYNYHRQRSSHPLSGFSGLEIQNNKYTSAQLNRQLTSHPDEATGFPWEIDKTKGALWYFENKYRNGNGDCNILTNVNPNFTKQDYLNAGFSQSTLDQWGGATGYEFMQNMLNDIFMDGNTGPNNGYNTYGIGGQNP